MLTDKPLTANTSAFFRSVAMAMKLTKSFVLTVKRLPSAINIVFKQLLSMSLHRVIIHINHQGRQQLNPPSKLPLYQ